MDLLVTTRTNIRYNPVGSIVGSQIFTTKKDFLTAVGKYYDALKENPELKISFEMIDKGY